MKERIGLKIFLKHVPAFKKPHVVLLSYLYQILIFVIFIVFFWWISSTFLLGAIAGELINSACFVAPYIYILKNSDRIRKKYREKYGKLAYQRFYYRFAIYLPPLGSSSMLFPILLISYDFLPRIISPPSHFISNSLLPFFVAIPLGIFILITGRLIRRPSGGFDVDIWYLVQMIYPEENREIKNGYYEFIRHPEYLGDSVAIIGLGILANNILALGVALLHAFSYIFVIKVEDDELIRRFGDSFKEYQKKVPAFFPKYGNWKKFAKLIFSKK